MFSIGRLALSLLFLFPLIGRAEQSQCEETYRNAYMAVSSGVDDNVWLRDASRLYEIYFDYANHLDVVHDEIMPLLQALGAGPGKESVVLETLTRKIQTGELCHWFGWATMTFSEAIDVLRPAVSECAAP